jgi:hypothetical protein
MAMKQSNKTGAKAAVGRRDVLRALSAGAAATAVAPMAGEARAETWNEAEKQKARYRLSEHIKEFYRVNRYPG